jgi:hypothetical protein
MSRATCADTFKSISSFTCAAMNSDTPKAWCREQGSVICCRPDRGQDCSSGRLAANLTGAGSGLDLVKRRVVGSKVYLTKKES